MRDDTPEALAVLPAGFRDRLPPKAAASAHLVQEILDHFVGYGYDRVAPPMAEFEASLTLWLGKPQTPALFRSPDPATAEALAIRPDITGQIARIAATRLADAPRPLRLAYAGPVLRARAGQLDPARELTQLGAELIGNDGVAATAEIINMALGALRACGIAGPSVDLTTPELVDELASGIWPVDDLPALAAALDSKDAGALAGLDGEKYRVLLEAAGPAQAGLEKLKPIAADLADRLGDLVGRIDGASVTIDPTERHGFEYQSWIGFSIFGSVGGAPLRTEIGRGGSYLVRRPDGATEPAVGVSLYIDALVEAGLGRQTQKRVFLPFGTSPDTGAHLRADGWQTVQALTKEDGTDGCTNVWDGARVISKD